MTPFRFEPPARILDRRFTDVKSGSQLAKDCRGVLGRFRAELEDRLRWERISLGKAHSEAVREIESLAGEVYRSGMEGAEGRAREAARRDGLAVYDRYRGEDWDRLNRSASEERMEQVREFDGEQAYEKMMRAMEKADEVINWLEDNQVEEGIKQLAGEYRVRPLLESVEPH